MGNNIRIGKDFNVQWAINKVVDGERLPYDLVGKELQLYIVNDNGRKEVAGWKVQGNVIEWTYLGKDQRRLGAYQLVLVENAGKEGMVTVDTCKAFNLVEHSCEENVDGGNGIVIKTVTLESDVALAPVVKEVGGGASEEDIQEIKNDIADLQQENERLKERIEEQDQFIEDLQNTKIDRENDDYYPKMAVGLADNLAGVDVVDSEINFRRSGGGAISDGVARIESIKGNSVVWNQLLEPTHKGNGRLKVYKENGKWVAEVTEVGNNSVGANLTIPVFKGQKSVQGHKYLAILDVTNDYSHTPAVKIGNKYETGTFHIIESSDSSLMYLYPFGAGSSTQIAQGSKAVLNVALFCDLTKFGASNESTTIEEFYARIPMGVDLNAYNEGEVIHMDVQSIESQGVNAWDEEWEAADFNDSGLPVASTSRIASKNFIQVLPNTQYYIHSNVTGNDIRVLFYNSDKAFISQTSWIGSNTKHFVTPANAFYVKFKKAGTTYNHDICINISDSSINGKYFPYIKRVEDLSIIRKYFPDGMKSAGSAHDEIRYNKESNKWESKDALIAVKMKDLTWGGSTQNNYTHAFRAALGIGEASGNNVMCRRFVRKSDTAASAWITDSNPYTIAYYSGYIGVNDPAYTDVNAFIASLTDDDILYIERAEPIVMELDKADQYKDFDIQVWNGGTEKANAESKSAPLAADITYGFNAIGKIKELESLVAALRAKVGI